VPDVPSFGGEIARSIAGLALLCLGLWVALRLLRGRLQRADTRGPLRVLAQRSLEPRRTLFLVEAAGRCFLIGASEAGLTTLAELLPDEVARVRAQERARPAVALRPEADVE
jgi:flagellar biogenesis protein FliO